MNIYELQPRFAKLFDGLDIAFGYASKPPQWIKRPPRPEDWIDHLTAKSPGIGIAPLRPDNTVMFGAIDLDEPDFEAARAMQGFIPGRSWIERSKSGNAHVWVFFKEPLEAWVCMGILKEAIVAGGKEHVEVFPKNHDFSRVQFGNYINLPFHGSSRPIIDYDPSQSDASARWAEYTPERFVELAEAERTDPELWRKTARWLLINPPDERQRSAEFGTQPNLHICAEHVLSGEAGPVTVGHRSVVYFSLAKMLTNWALTDHDEVVDMLRAVNEASAPDSIDDEELLRIIGNAERGQFTSTGCDDPLFVPFAHPDCPIANPRR